MQLQMRQTIQLTHQLVQQISIALSLPSIQWSLVQAFESGMSGPPPYAEPNLEAEEFEPRIKVARTMIDGFKRLSHMERLHRIDEANKVFRFVYTRGVGEADGRTLGYFKVPLLRDYHADPDKIRIRVTATEYGYATAMIAAVGEMERIARAVRYLELYQETLKHLKRMGAKLENAVLVSVDRGGRIPCTLLQRALDLPTMFTLKVDQGSNGDGLDEDKLLEFESRGELRGKHVLFVDSTVDSGRQYQCLTRFFDNTSWQTRLGHIGWSLIGSNENGQNVGPKHQNVNWGVDPDTTFEDRPELMGIDYAPGTFTKVVERPCDASRAIRACLLSVPDGWIYDADDAGEQIKRQYKQWASKRRVRHSEHRAENRRLRSNDRLERQLERIVGSKLWQTLRAKHASLPEETFSSPATATTSTMHGNVLVIGSGKQTLPDASVAFVADSLVLHCSLLAGTPDGNPGAVLKAALKSSQSASPEVRLYQPEHSRKSGDDRFGGVPVTYVGPEKEDMRKRMVSDATVVLVLGGNEGTLREALIALAMGKPIVFIKGYGPVADYVLGQKSLRNKAGLTACDDLTGAVGKLVAMLAA